MPEQAHRGKKTKSRDDRPARARYWAKRTLEAHKVKNLVRYGYSPEKALRFWREHRKGRVPNGFIFTFSAPLPLEVP